MRDRNYMAHGHANICDPDLQDMYSLVSRLPWMEQVLQELQFLRSVGNTCARCEELENILGNIGAEYDGRK